MLFAIPGNVLGQIQAVKITFVVKICFGMGFAGSGTFIIFFCFLLVAYFVITYA